MIIKNNNKLKYFKKTDKFEFKDIYSPNNISIAFDHIVDIDNDYYYFKNKVILNSLFSKYYKIINEIIGSNLCELLELDSLKYDIAISDNYVYTISKYLFDKKYTYKYIKDEYTTCTKLLYDHSNKLTCKIELLDQLYDNKELLNDMLKLIAVDLRMGQEDRHDYNIMLKKNKDTDSVSFAPMYDFSNSYMCRYGLNNNLYESSLVVLGRDYYPIYKLCKKYPIFYEYINKVCSVSIDDILIEIENKYNIEFTKREILNYRVYDNNNVKILKMVK